MIKSANLPVKVDEVLRTQCPNNFTLGTPDNLAYASNNIHKQSCTRCKENRRKRFGKLKNKRITLSNKKKF